MAELLSQGSSLCRPASQLSVRVGQRQPVFLQKILCAPLVLGGFPDVDTGPLGKEDSAEARGQWECETLFWRGRGGGWILKLM